MADLSDWPETIKSFAGFLIQDTQQKLLGFARRFIESSTESSFAGSDSKLLAAIKGVRNSENYETGEIQAGMRFSPQ